MPKFKKCPRCEINYIPEDKEYCPICEREMRGIVDAIPDDDEDYEEGLCPRCHTNYVAEGEKYCEQCLSEMQAKDDNFTDEFDDEEPETSIDDETLDDADLLDDEDLESLGQLAEEESEWDEEEEEYPD